MSGEAIFGHFEITRAKNAGQKPNPHGGQFDKWYVGLSNLDGGEGQDDAYWQRKAPSEVTVGDKVYGKLEEGQYGWRFFLEPEPDASGGGAISNPAPSGSSSNKGREWQPESTRDPERSARILRQHSQGVAVQILTAMGAFDTQDAQGLHRKIQQWCDFLDQDVLKTASQAEGPAPQQAGAAPLPSASPSPDSQAPRDEHQWFKNLLEAAALEPEPAHVLAEFITTKFNPEQKVRAEAGLEDFNSQMDTLAKLKASYEQMEKKSLPSGGQDDEIPF